MLDDFTAGGSSSFRIEKLDLDINFETYSDAKLANLFFENDISIVAMKKFFGVILDPKFISQEVTFTSVLDTLERISLRRRQSAMKRELRGSPFKTDPLAVTTANNIPPTVLELVVETMLEDSMPLCIAALEPYWKDAYAKNGLDFRNMSLVHCSWTAVAQRALRRRVVVPYHRINMFLLSPLCGPWVKEMVIYWTVDDGCRNVIREDILLLEALFKCTPNIHALSFNTCLFYPCGYDDVVPYESTWDVNDCLDALSELPSLKHLWLKHLRRPDVEKYTYRPPVPKKNLYSFPGLHSLYTRLPKFQSLELLSIWGWCSSSAQPSLSLNQHPPHRLKGVEFHFQDTYSHQYGFENDESRTEQYRVEDLVWLLKPRDDYRLESLSFADQQYQITEVLVEALGECLTNLLKLQLHMPSRHRRLPNILAGCKKLESLDLFIDENFRFFYGNFNKKNPFILPSSLRHWEMHYLHVRDPLYRPNADSIYMFLRKLEHRLPRLPHLEEILMMETPRLATGRNRIWGMTWDGSYRHMSKAFEEYQKSAMQKFGEQFKMKYDVELSCYQNVFPPEWDLIST